MSLKSEIKKVVEKNCMEDKYAEIFSPQVQKMIKKNSTKIAEMTCEDEDFKDSLELSIEDSIRLLILKSK